MDFKRFTRTIKGERIIANSGADIKYGGYKAFYNEAGDFIGLPERKNFKDIEGFYSVAFHELIHWTGGAKRLNREKSLNKLSKTYAFEELVAEIGSSFMSAETGIAQTEEQFKNHAGYVNSWITLLENDSSAIFRASAEASKAVEFLLKNY